MQYPKVIAVVSGIILASSVLAGAQEGRTNPPSATVGEYQVILEGMSVEEPQLPAPLDPRKRVNFLARSLHSSGFTLNQGTPFASADFRVRCKTQDAKDRLFGAVDFELLGKDGTPLTNAHSLFPGEMPLFSAGFSLSSDRLTGNFPGHPDLDLSGHARGMPFPLADLTKVHSFTGTLLQYATVEKSQVELDDFSGKEVKKQLGDFAMTVSGSIDKGKERIAVTLKAEGLNQASNEYASAEKVNKYDTEAKVFTGDNRELTSTGRRSGSDGYKYDWEYTFLVSPEDVPGLKAVITVLHRANPSIKVPFEVKITE